MKFIMKKHFWIIVTLLLFICGCEYYGEVAPEHNVGASGTLTSYRLTLVGQYGTGSEPITLGDGKTVKIKVEAIDSSGEIIEGHSANLKFSAKNTYIGRNGWQYLDVTSGETVDVDLKRGIGPIRILAEDEETLCLGVSDIIYLPEPSMQTVQTPVNSGDSSPWISHFVRIETGTLIVTHVGLDGFYITDVSADSYNSIYVYTHGIPETDRGDKLKYIAGTISEFYGLTELSFPDYEVDCHYYPLPEPINLTASMLSDNTEMEKYEGSLVMVENLKVAEVDEQTYYSYGQWKGETGDGGFITVISRETFSDLDPRTFNGTITKMVGIMRQHYAANPDWMLLPRNECDVWGFGERPYYCDSKLPETTCK